METCLLYACSQELELSEACGLKWSAIELEQEGLVRVIRSEFVGIIQTKASFFGRCDKNLSVSQTSYAS